LEKQFEGSSQFSVFSSQLRKARLASSGNPPPDNPQFELPRFEPSPSPAERTPAAPVPMDCSAPSLFAPPAAPLPVRDPVWTGWDVFLIALLIVFGGVVLGAIYALCAHLLYPRVSLKDLGPLLTILAQVSAYILVGIYMVLMVEGKYKVPFWRAIRWNWPQGAAWKLLGLGVLTVSLDFLSHYLPMPKNTPFDAFFNRPRDAYLTVIFAVSLAPLMEEVFFRGFLYPLLARRMGVMWGVLLTALPFGLIHYVTYQAWSPVIVVTMVGLVFTVVRVATKSVAASFLVHAGYNSTLMLIAALATNGFRHMERTGMILK
jgi:membrane protease YdiL (CAAX protease family)